MASPLPANVNLIQLLAAAPGTTITGVEPLESVQSGTSVAFTLNQVNTFVQTNMTALATTAAGLSVFGVAGSAVATMAPIVGAADQVLIVNHAGTGLLFGPVNLATSAAVTGILAAANMTSANLATTSAGGVQGVLPVANAGIGTATLSAYAALFAGTTATAAIQQATATTAGYPLVANGSTSLAGFQALNLTSTFVTSVLGNVNGGIGLNLARGLISGGTTSLGLTLSTVASLGVFVGTGSPSISAATSSLYLRNDATSTSTRLYINKDGGTTWTAILALG